MVKVVSIIDVLPIGMIPGPPQIVGQVLDFTAFAGTQGILVADFANDTITGNQFILGSVLNTANVILGTAGNILTGPGNIVLSVLEGGILYLQYRVTLPEKKPCG